MQLFSKWTTIPACVLLVVALCHAETYYVDATNGKDTNSGTSESSPWQTLSKVNDANLGQGDRVLLERGEAWRGESLRARSGMTIGAYGSGARPKIDGTIVVPNSSFNQSSGVPNTFKLKEERSVSQVLEDSVRLQRASRKSEVGDRPGSWYWAKGALHVHASDDSNIKNNGKQYEVGVVNDAIYAGDERNVTIEEVHILNCGDMGVYGINSDHLVVRNCIIEYIKKSGPGSPDGIGLNHNTSNAVIEGNVIHDIGDRKEGAGVYIGTAGANLGYNAHDNIVRNNEIYNCVVGVTIKVHSVDNLIDGNHIHHVVHQAIRSVNRNTVTRNFIHDCEEEGIETYNDAIVAYNFVRKCHAGVIVLSVTSSFVDHQKVGRSNQVVNNTVTDCVIGVSIFNTKTARTTQPRDNIIKNNLFYDCYRQLLIADPNGLPDDHNNQFDYNCYYSSTGRVLFRNGPGESDDVTFAQWQQIYGDDAHSITQDPRLTSSSPQTVPDIRLAGDSPCVDAALDVGLVQDLVGTSVPQGNGVDMGAHEFAGSGRADGPPAPPRNVRAQVDQ